MSVYIIFCYTVWAVLFGVWTLKRFGNKPALHLVRSKRFLLLYFAYALLFLSPFAQDFGQAVLIGRAWGLFGTVMCFLGAGFALWARLVLGSNWSAKAEEKVGHSLVTVGPYALARHPIYTGFLLGMLGFALTVGTAWSFAAFIFGAVALLARIPVEEKIMSGLFGEKYIQYSQSTKKLLPFVW